MSNIYIGIIVPAFVLLPLITGLIQYRQLLPAQRLVLYYLIVSAPINGIAIFLSYKGINNLPLLHLLTVAELFFLLYYIAGIVSSPVARKMIWVVAFIAICLSIANSIWLQPIHKFNSYARGLTAIVILAAALGYLLLEKEAFKKTADINITIALALYYSGSFLLFLFANYLKKGYALSSIVWNVNATLVLLMYLLFTRAFCYAARK